MSRLTELLRQAHKADAQLGADLEVEIIALTKRRTFGLVFEQHQPEAVELPGRPVRRGDKVRGLADFAERFATDFRRIESVAETGGVLRVLDITKPRVREAIRDAQSARALYESEVASDY